MLPRANCTQEEQIDFSYAKHHPIRTRIDNQRSAFLLMHFRVFVQMTTERKNWLVLRDEFSIACAADMLFKPGTQVNFGVLRRSMRDQDELSSKIFFCCLDQRIKLWLSCVLSSPVKSSATVRDNLVLAKLNNLVVDKQQIWIIAA